MGFLPRLRPKPQEEREPFEQALFELRIFERAVLRADRTEESHRVGNRIWRAEGDRLVFRFNPHHAIAQSEVPPRVEHLRKMFSEHVVSRRGSRRVIGKPVFSHAPIDGGIHELAVNGLKPGLAERIAALLNRAPAPG